MNPRPWTRSCTIVAIMFTDPSMDDVMITTMPMSHTVCPGGIITARGG